MIHGAIDHKIDANVHRVIDSISSVSFVKAMDKATLRL